MKADSRRECVFMEQVSRRECVFMKQFLETAFKTQHCTRECVFLKTGHACNCCVVFLAHFAAFLLVICHWESYLANGWLSRFCSVGWIQPSSVCSSSQQQWCWSLLHWRPNLPCNQHLLGRHHTIISDCHEMQSILVELAVFLLYFGTFCCTLAKFTVFLL